LYLYLASNGDQVPLLRELYPTYTPAEPNYHQTRQDDAMEALTPDVVETLEARDPSHQSILGNCFDYGYASSPFLHRYLAWTNEIHDHLTEE
jgi:hypothetical protein